MLGGGLHAGTTTLVAGSPGVGKTLLGLHLLVEGARRDEPGLLAGFTESAAQLRQKAHTFGLALGAAEAAGQIELLTVPPHDLDADRVAWLLRERIEARGVRRLVIDSVAELERGIAPDERKAEFFAALTTYLRGQGVTACLTLDVPKTVGQDLDLVGTPFSVLAENLILLRDVEYLGQPHRVVSVLKMRFSGYDRSIREYEPVPGRGIQVLGVAPATAGQPTGSEQRSLEQR
jgi:circadian clock protein KaiC